MILYRKFMSLWKREVGVCKFEVSGDIAHTWCKQISRSDVRIEGERAEGKKWMTRICQWSKMEGKHREVSKKWGTHGKGVCRMISVSGLLRQSSHIQHLCFCLLCCTELCSPPATCLQSPVPVRRRTYISLVSHCLLAENWLLFNKKPKPKCPESESRVQLWH